MGVETVRGGLQDVDPGRFGTRPARTDVDTHADPYYPYVQRPLDQQLASALVRRIDGTDKRPLLIVGPAMAGASRTVVEALHAQARLAGWTFVAPEPGTDPDNLLDRLPPEPEGAVVWLDHLDHLDLGPTRWGAPALESRRHRVRLLVVASAHAEMLEAVLADRDFHSPWSLLADPSSVEIVRLPPWSVHDLPSEGVDPLIVHRVAAGQSLGQALGAADELLAAVREHGPVTEAVARVVVDWARMGLAGGVPEQVAEQLWPEDLDTRRSHQLDQDSDRQRRDRFTAALATLTRPLRATGARPVRRAGADRLVPDAYLVADPPPAWSEIPHHVWSAGLVHARATGDPQTLLALGLRAYLAEAHDVARGAWDAVARMDHPSAGWGWALLGQLHAAQDDDPGRAEAALANAIASGHPDAGPAAGAALGRLLEVRDPRAAREAYERVIAGGHPSLAPEAALRLGWLLEWDDPAAAREAYATAIQSGHPGLAPEAAVYLAWMLESEDRTAAEEAYRTAIASGHPEWAPKAAADLGWMLAESDPQAAREAYDIAVASDHPEWRPRAAVRLGQLLAGTDPAAAATAYEVAVASRHGEWAASAAVRLGRLLVSTDTMAACAALRVAMASKHAEYAPTAELLYGEWCVGSDAAARWRHWSRAASSRSPRVLVDLACLCLAEGATDLARRALASAAQNGSSFAEDYLHIIGLDVSDLPHDESFVRVRRAAEAGDTATMNVLGLLAVGWGDLGAARNWWSRSAAEHDLIAPLLLRRHP